MMGAILPPEIGAVLEEMFGEIAASPGGSWMNEHVEFDSAEYHGITVSRLHVKNENIGGLLSKSVGHYSTLYTGPLNRYERHKDICSCLMEELRRYLAPYKGKTLCICGLGNADFIYDCLGPETAKRITPKIPVQSDFEKTAIFCPGVDGLTNINVSTSISSVASAINAACIIAIDATECSDCENLCGCIQLTDAGLSFHMDGEILRQSNTGIPVIGIGIPTVIRADKLSPELNIPSDNLLTVSQIDYVVKMAASIIACAILQVVYPELDYDDCKAIVDNSQLY